MPRSRPIRSTFDAGEWSPSMAGRVDLQKYPRAAKTIENFLVQPQGGLLRRAGTRYVANAKPTDYDPVLLPFEFGPDQSLVLEIGEGYMRPYTLGGRVIVSATTGAIVNGDFANGLTGWTDKSTGGSIAATNGDVLVQGNAGTDLGNMTLGGGIHVPFGGVRAAIGYRYHRLQISGGNASTGFGVAHVAFYTGGRVLLADAAGTPIGNLTANVQPPGSVPIANASCFTTSTKRDWAQCARSAASPAYIGKDWGVGVTRVLTGFSLISTHDKGLKFEDDPTVTFVLQGSTDNFASSVVTLATYVVPPVSGVISFAFFDDTLNSDWVSCAQSAGNVGWIGKDWGSTKTITGFVARGSTSDGFKKGENPLVLVVLEGSSDNFATVRQLGSVYVTDTTGPIAATLFSGIEVGTAYRYHRLVFYGGNAGIGFAVGQVQFFEQGASSGRMRLIPGAGTAAGEQQVTLGAGEIGHVHSLTYRVTSDHGGQAVVQIGSTSGAADILAATIVTAGQFTASFTPTGTANFLRFSSFGTDETQIDDVAFLSDQPYELALPYQRSDLAALSTAQLGDVMWVVHKNYAPRKLIRYDFGNWQAPQIQLIDGPYLDENLNDGIVITASAATGSAITLTATAAIFQAGHIGSSWRLCATGGVPGCKTWAAATAVNSGDNRKWVDNVYRATNSATTGNSPPIHDRGTVSDGVVSWRFVNRDGWGYVVITGFTDSTHVTAKVVKELDPSVVSSGTAVWREGAFSAVRGYPSGVALVSGSRLLYGKEVNFYLSRVGLFDDFSPDGQDDDAIYGLIDGAIGSPIAWAVDHARIVLGNSRGIWTLQSANDEPLTPKNVQVKQQTAAGSASIPPVKADNAILYLSRSGRLLYEITPTYDAALNGTGYRAVDATVLADHIMANGANLLRFTREPFSAAWAMREDGQIATLTYSQAESIVAWSRQILGGHHFGTAPAIVCAMAVIPGSNDDQKRDQLWLCVRRYVAGREMRHIEYVQANVRAESSALDAWHVDAGSSYDGLQLVSLVPGTRSDFAEAKNVGFFTGSDWFVPADVGRKIRTGDSLAEITQYVSPTEVLCDIISAFVAPDSEISAGNWQLSAQTFSGLDYLEGETVAAWVDGGEHDALVVSGGQVTLDVQAFNVVVGLPISYRYDSLKLIEGGQLGPTIGVKKRASRIQVGLVQSLECNIGMDPDRLQPILFRDAEQNMAAPPPLFSGEKVVQLTEPYSTDPRIIIAGSGAGPLCVTHVVIDDLDQTELS